MVINRMIIFKSCWSDMGWFSPVDADPRLIIMAGGLIIVDRSCDAFDPVHAPNNSANTSMQAESHDEGEEHAEDDDHAEKPAGESKEY